MGQGTIGDDAGSPRRPPGKWPKREGFVTSCLHHFHLVFPSHSRRLPTHLAPGTTTATVLTRAILAEGCKSVAAGMNPMDLRRGINMAVEHVVGVLKARAKMISTTEEIAQVGGGDRREEEGDGGREVGVAKMVGKAVPIKAVPVKADAQGGYENPPPQQGGGALVHTDKYEVSGSAVHGEWGGLGRGEEQGGRGWGRGRAWQRRRG